MQNTLLPADWYFDETHYQRERQAIFSDNWVLFCPEHELEKSGAYRADNVYGWEILVVRSRDGELKGFHNNCRHRGTQLKHHGGGKCNTIVCPYHAWSYDLDGFLVQTPGFDEPTGFDRKDFELKPVRVDSWAGLVFVCIGDAAPGLLTWLGALPELCKEFGSPESLVYYDAFSIEASANWKLFCENTVEGYHLDTVHQDLNTMVDEDNTTIRDYDNGTLVVFHVAYQSTGKDKRGGTGIWWYKFPGFQGVCSSKSFRADRIEPLDAENTRIIDWSWNFEDMPKEERDEGYRFARQIVSEDIGPCESIQSNLQNGSYKQGILSPTREKHVIRFQEQVKQRVKGAAVKGAGGIKN